MKTAAIIQARLDSSRLDKKVVKRIEGKTLLSYIIERFRLVQGLDDIIIATTEKESDRELLNLAENMGVKSFTGSESDVLGRYYQCAVKFKVENILRATADNPFIDPSNLEQMIKHHIEDHADVTFTKSMPIGTGLGMAIISFSALEKANKNAKTEKQREHVIPFFFENISHFKILALDPPIHFNRPEYRLTVDTEEDLKFVREIYRRLYREGSIINLEDVLKLIDNNPNLLKINSHLKSNREEVEALENRVIG